MPFFAILGVMFLQSLVFPRATKYLIVSPINGLVLGGLGWSIIAIMNPGFNRFPMFCLCVGIMTLFFWVFVLTHSED